MIEKPPFSTVMTQIVDYLEITEGYFKIQDLYYALNAARDIKKQATIRRNLTILVKGGTLERYGKRDGVYRRPDKSIKKMNFSNPGGHNFNIKWPLDLQKICRTLQKNIIIISGEFEAGKTAFLLATAALNLNKKQKIYLFNSDCGEEELNERLNTFDIPIWEWEEGMEAYERSDNFQDVIRADAINIIDYLEVTEDFYLVGKAIFEIWKKLNKGIAIIGLQKDEKRDGKGKATNVLGRGKTFSAEKARIYLSLTKNYPDGGIATIIKGKLRADKHINPTNMQCTYKLIQGCDFIQESDWHRPEQKDRWSG